MPVNTQKVLQKTHCTAVININGNLIHLNILQGTIMS